MGSCKANGTAFLTPIELRKLASHYDYVAKQPCLSVIMLSLFKYMHNAINRNITTHYIIVGIISGMQKCVPGG